MVDSTTTKFSHEKIVMKKSNKTSDNCLRFDLPTILAIKIRTALKCHNLLNFNRSEMIFFSKFASSKDLSNETKLVPVSLSV